jgi:membrane-anchored glycerophosphoryl diester phosphodiesterase (GDPDase)
MGLEVLILVIAAVLVSAYFGIIIIHRSASGFKASQKACTDTAKSKIGAVIATEIIYCLILFCIILAGVGAAVLGSLTNIGAIAFVGALVLLSVIVIAFYVSMRLSVSIPCMLFLADGPISALKESWKLSKGSVWRIFAIDLLIAIVSEVLTSIPNFFSNLILVTNTAVKHSSGTMNATVNATATEAFKASVTSPHFIIISLVLIFVGVYINTGFTFTAMGRIYSELISIKRPRSVKR